MIAVKEEKSRVASRRASDHGDRRRRAPIHAAAAVVAAERPRLRWAVCDIYRYWQILANQKILLSYSKVVYIPDTIPLELQNQIYS